VAAKPAFVGAETAWRMMTTRDPWVNLLRTTIATFAAGLGGADAITVLPFTAARGLPDRFARRLARNTQFILLEESNLAKVADPAAGSGAIEQLTRQLCAVAWSLFQDIEKQGGIWPTLQEGALQRQIAAVRTERQKAVAHRRDALTGTSEFPDIKEEPIAVIDARPMQVRPPAAAVSIEPLRSMRLAEPYEALRDASDHMLAATGSRPKVFLANLGKPPEFHDRANFAKNFFEAGGIEAVTNEGFATREDLVAAFRASGAKLACLCSSDKVYAGEAGDAAKALAAAGAKHIYLAGRPTEPKPSDVQTFIHADGDALATLRAAHDI
jgi:methylmalonyl-CoA mutase